MARVLITDDIHAELLRLKKQSGMGMMKLLARSGPAPDGLDSAIINSWLSRKTTSARKDHLAYALGALRSVDPIIEIKPEMRAMLDAELTRTGYEPTTLLNRLAPCPAKLNAVLVSRWRTGHTRSAQKSLWDFVLDGLKAAPSKRLK